MTEPPNNTTTGPSAPVAPRSPQQPPPKKDFSLWKDYISPVFCCCSRKEGYQEIGAETAEEMTQRIQDLYGMFDRLNEQLQSVQSSSEMQRILQERLVEQVHELDDIITGNRSQLLTEIQKLMLGSLRVKVGPGSERKRRLFCWRKSNRTQCYSENKRTLS